MWIGEYLKKVVAIIILLGRLLWTFNFHVDDAQQSLCYMVVSERFATTRMRHEITRN